MLVLFCCLFRVGVRTETEGIVLSNQITIVEINHSSTRLANSLLDLKGAEHPISPVVIVTTWQTLVGSLLIHLTVGT